MDRVWAVITAPEHWLGQGDPAGFDLREADPTRRRLLDVLAASGEATATRLAVDLPVSRQAVVEHLAVLEQAGLVSAGGSAARSALRRTPSR